MFDKYCSLIRATRKVALIIIKPQTREASKI
jgi:hypothetical protein